MSGQAKPDFSGKWTETDVAAGRPATTMTVSQDSNAVTIEYGPDSRYTFKLDGSQSRNVTTGGRYFYSRGLCFDENSWDRSDIFTTTSPKDEWCFITNRALRCLRRVGAKNVQALPLSDIERGVETLRRGADAGADEEQ